MSWPATRKFFGPFIPCPIGVTSADQTVLFVNTNCLYFQNGLAFGVTSADHFLVNEWMGRQVIISLCVYYDLYGWNVILVEPSCLPKVLQGALPWIHQLLGGRNIWSTAIWTTTECQMSPTGQTWRKTEGKLFLVEHNTFLSHVVCGSESQQLEETLSKRTVLLAWWLSIRIYWPRSGLRIPTTNHFYELFLPL